MKDKLPSWEPYARSLMRIVLAYVFILHGFRNAFGYFAVSGGRRALIPMALDSLPHAFGYLELIGGALLLLGLFVRPVALILSAQLLAAYLYSAAPRGPWPIRNGGNEVLQYLLAFLYIAVAGAGAWSLDRMLGRHKAAAG
jgi:putative oxidoreductase